VYIYTLTVVTLKLNQLNIIALRGYYTLCNSLIKNHAYIGDVIFEDLMLEEEAEEEEATEPSNNV